MAVLTIQELKEELSFTEDLGGEDDAMLGRKVEAAVSHIERLLGYQIEDRFDSVPAPLSQAAAMLAAHWYEQREAVVIGSEAMPVPFSVAEIIQEYREYAF